MYTAELQGKLSSSQEQAEDILTSNVFSFFKYASRSVYLRGLLSLLDVALTYDELEEAEFIFWPNYDDRTQPDLVILAGSHYILFEAKYLSKIDAGQIQREIEGGVMHAETQKKDNFIMTTVTAHRCRPNEEFPQRCRSEIKWINWQSISGLLLDALGREDVPDALFAKDLYDLLVKKELRGFLSFDRLVDAYVDEQVESVFFDARRSDFRGVFIGFGKALGELGSVEKRTGKLFYS